MSEITNDSGLPMPLVEAVRNDSYDRGDSDITVTQLITPPRILALRKKHDAQMKEDAADRLWALIGQIGHGIIQRGTGEGYLCEERFYIEREGKKIGGQIDLFDKTTHELSDWKIVSMYQTRDGAKEEWTQQANLLRLLLIENGYAVKSANFYAIYRDWSKMAAERKKGDYPQKQVERFSLELWPLDQTEDFIKDRLFAHEDAARTLPECSPAQRWQRPEKFAVMKAGNKRATKLFDIEEQANELAATIKNGRVEYREGEAVRCQWYCNCLPYCRQGQELIRRELAKIFVGDARP